MLPMEISEKKKNKKFNGNVSGFQTLPMEISEKKKKKKKFHW
jgi:hypothetical protein